MKHPNLRLIKHRFQTPNGTVDVSETQHYNITTALNILQNKQSVFLFHRSREQRDEPTFDESVPFKLSQLKYINSTVEFYKNKINTAETVVLTDPETWSPAIRELHSFEGKDSYNLQGE